MGEFEAYAQSVTSGLDLSETMKIRIAEEVVAHLEDETRRCLAEGMPPAEARRAALERFGQEQIIGRLIAGALEHKQGRFRQWCATRTAVITTVLVIVSMSVGAWFTVFDEAVTNSKFAESMPRLAWSTLYLGGCLGCLGILAAVVAPLFRVRWVAALLSFLAVALVFGASVCLFDALPALRNTIGTAHGGESERTRFINAFCMRLYLCWVPTVATGIIVTLVSRRRARVRWLAVPLAAGLLSAALWAFDQLPLRAPWMYWMKWSTLLATGLAALIFVVLTGLLARALAERFRWSKDSKGHAWLGIPPTPEDSATPVRPI